MRMKHCDTLSLTPKSSLQAREATFYLEIGRRAHISRHELDSFDSLSPPLPLHLPFKRTASQILNTHPSTPAGSANSVLQET